MEEPLFFFCGLQQKTIINALLVNEDGVMVTGGRNLQQQIYIALYSYNHIILHISVFNLVNHILI